MHSALWDISFPDGQSSCFNSKTSISYTTRGWHPVPPTSSPYLQPPVQQGVHPLGLMDPVPPSNAQKGTHTMLRSSWHFVSTLTWLHFLRWSKLTAVILGRSQTDDAFGTTEGHRKPYYTLQKPQPQWLQNRTTGEKSRPMAQRQARLRALANASQHRMLYCK